MDFEAVSRSPIGSAAHAKVSERVAFIRRTYAHLAGAIVAFVALEWLIFQMPWHKALVESMMGVSWLLVLGAFMVVGWVADRWARAGGSPTKQYLGLGLYVVAEAIIFLPLLYMAANFSGPEVIPIAALLTLTMFIGLTGTVFLTGKDFSFLRGALGMGAIGAFALIALGILFGFSLGLWFSFAMVLLSAGYTLYYTSSVLRDYRTDQHVAASLALFAAIALMFFYVLRLVMAFSGRD